GRPRNRWPVEPSAGHHVLWRKGRRAQEYPALRRDDLADRSRIDRGLAGVAVDPGAASDRNPLCRKADRRRCGAAGADAGPARDIVAVAAWRPAERVD